MERMMKRRVHGTPLPWFLATLLMVGACGGPHRLEDENLLTREAALARFQEPLERTGELRGGAPSRDSLVGLFVRALENRDTAGLAGLAMTVEEFAFLYYPDNPQSLPPYDLRPGLMWQMLRMGSERGLARLLNERAGSSLGVVGYTCDLGVSLQGENRVTGPCLLQRETSAGDTTGERLFGLILERGGRFKFASYANSLE